MGSAAMLWHRSVRRSLKVSMCFRISSFWSFCCGFVQAFRWLTVWRYGKPFGNANAISQSARKHLKAAIIYPFWADLTFIREVFLLQFLAYFSHFKVKRAKNLETNQRGVNWYRFEACEWNGTIQFLKALLPGVREAMLCFTRVRTRHNGCNQCHGCKYAMLVA